MMKNIENFIRKEARKVLNESAEDIEVSIQRITDRFYERIKELLKNGAAKDHPSVKRELERMTRVIPRDVIPEKIAKLLS